MGLSVSDLVFVRIKYIILRAPIICAILKSYAKNLYLDGVIDSEFFKSTNKDISEVNGAMKSIFKKVEKYSNQNLLVDKTAITETIDFMQSVGASEKIDSLDRVFKSLLAEDMGKNEVESLSKTDFALITEDLKEIRTCFTR